VADSRHRSSGDSDRDAGSSGNRAEGQRGEEMALKTLRSNGYTIIERNHRNRLGEIDIVAEENGCLVFVEVKKRNTGRYGEALCAVDDRKKRHLVKAALLYMKIHNCFGREVRFDVIGIDKDRTKLVKNAFLVEDRFFHTL
jgi:putative endonuclease